MAQQPGHEMGYCWKKHGPRQLHCCRPPFHSGACSTPYGGGATVFRSRLKPRS